MSRTNGRISCEQVREVLPEYAEPGPRPAGAVEVHLATCVACRAELESYRELLSSLAAYRDVEVAAGDAYLDTMLRTARTASLRRRIPGRAEIRAASGRAVATVKAHGTGVRYAAATVGGAAAGATAIAIVWWSLARRAMTGAGG